MAPWGALASLSQEGARARAYQRWQMRVPWLSLMSWEARTHTAYPAQSLDPSFVPVGVWPCEQEPEVVPVPGLPLCIEDT